jgi:hypothetical protein
LETFRRRGRGHQPGRARGLQGVHPHDHCAVSDDGGEVRINRSTYQVKPFYLSSETVLPTYQVKPFYLSNQTVPPFKRNLCRYSPDMHVDGDEATLIHNAVQKVLEVGFTRRTVYTQNGLHTERLTCRTVYHTQDGLHAERFTHRTWFYTHRRARFLRSAALQRSLVACVCVNIYTFGWRVFDSWDHVSVYKMTRHTSFIIVRWCFPFCWCCWCCCCCCCCCCCFRLKYTKRGGQ